MDDAYVLLKTYTQSHQAQMDLNMLKNEGINAYITDSNMGTFGTFGVATGFIKLHVAEKDLKQAQQLVDVQ
jgi:hypothetical protein